MKKIKQFIISNWDRTKRLANRFKVFLLRPSSLVILSLLGILAVVILLIWQIPQWQARGINHPKDRATIENAARSTFVQAVGGLFLFVTAYLSFQNLKVTQQNLVATQEKQVTERFAKAIEQLANQNIHVRLGAIYALERIAKDSDRDYWQVMEILTAYVRETSPYPSKNSRTSESLVKTWLSTETVSKSKKNTDSDSELFVVTDVQAVLTVISRRTKSYSKGEEYSFNFSKSNLRNANLFNANLRNANLSYTNLRNANLFNANLINADLRNSNLFSANLFSANLINAYLANADLSRADLRNANLSRAYLANAYLFSAYLLSADLTNAYLTNVNFTSADLSGVNFTSADLRNVNFTSADLSGVNFTSADLSNANFISAVLINTNLTNANLSNANFISAALINTNLTNANLTNANLTNAQNLTPEQVKQGTNWEQAKYDEEFRTQLGLPPETAENQGE